MPAMQAAQKKRRTITCVCVCMFRVLSNLFPSLPRRPAPSSMMMSVCMVYNVFVCVYTLAHSLARFPARIECLSGRSEATREEEERTKKKKNRIHHPSWSRCSRARARARMCRPQHLPCTHARTQDVRILSTLECPLITRARPSLLFSSAATATATTATNTTSTKNRTMSNVPAHLSRDALACFGS